MLGLGLDPLTLARGTAPGTATLPPLLVVQPTISGTGAVGTVLTGSAGVWVPRPGQSFTWAWQRDGVDIPGAGGTGPVVAPYMIVDTDHGALIRLRVTASTAAGDSTVFSTGIVAGYSAPAVEAVSWTVPLRLGEAMAPLPLAAAFAGLDLVFSVDPGGDPLPAGLSLAADGVLSGTPTGPAGSAAVGIVATNPGGSATLALVLQVRTALFSADHVAQVYTLGGTASTFAGLHGLSRSGTATRLDASGLLQVVSADTPRFDHDAAGAPLGLLVEGAETNRLTGSEDLTTGWSTTAVTATAAGLSVRGRWSGRVLASNGNAAGRLNQTLTLMAGEALPLTIFCLPGTSGRLRVQFRDPVGGQASRVRGAFGALAVVATDLGAVDGLEQTTAQDGVVTVSMVFRPGTTGNVEIGIGHDSAVAGQTLILLAAQTARGSFIPTAAAAVTRGADLIGLTGLAPGLMDLTLDHGDGDPDLLGSFPVDSGAWPILRRPHLRRMSGHAPGYVALTLADTLPLFLESGQALTLETPA